MQSFRIRMCVKSEKTNFNESSDDAFDCFFLKVLVKLFMCNTPGGTSNLPQNQILGALYNVDNAVCCSLKALLRMSRLVLISRCIGAFYSQERFYSLLEVAKASAIAEFQVHPSFF